MGISRYSMVMAQDQQGLDDSRIIHCQERHWQLNASSLVTPIVAATTEESVVGVSGMTQRR